MPDDSTQECAGCKGVPGEVRCQPCGAVLCWCCVEEHPCGKKAVPADIKDAKGSAKGSSKSFSGRDGVRPGDRADSGSAVQEEHPDELVSKLVTSSFAAEERVLASPGLEGNVKGRIKTLFLGPFAVLEEVERKCSFWAGN